MVQTMRYWLLKSEPDVFSFDDLKKRPKRMEPWNGVRNYQVRNMMRDQMTEGDLGLFYHSSCDVPGVAGVLRIASEAKPDPTQFDANSEYFDKGSTPEEPRWLLVDVAWEADFKQFVPLTALRAEPQLANMLILRKGKIMVIKAKERILFENSPSAKVLFRTSKTGNAPLPATKVEMGAGGEVVAYTGAELGKYSLSDTVPPPRAPGGTEAPPAAPPSNL